MAILFDDINHLITIEAPAVEVTCQDLLNAIREFEYSTAGIDDPQVALAAGKEPLGGGVLVGITLTLLNWKVKFEDRPGPDWVYCNVSGGNLVSLDSLGAFQFPLEPAEYVMATITASSSATVSELSAIQFSSFQNAAWIDIDSVYSGTAYPNGTRQFPVNNLADAIIISNNNGFDHIMAMSDLTINSGSDLIGFTIEGLSHTNINIDIQSTAEVFKAIIRNCAVSGVLDGGVEIWGCIVGDLDYVYGHIHDCGLVGTIVLDGGADAFFVNCTQPDLNLDPEIDMGGSGQDLAMVNFTGRLHLKNLTSDNIVGIGLSGGLVVLDTATVTDGLIQVTGIGQLVDELGNSIQTGTWNSGVTIVNELVNKANFAEGVWSALLSEHEIVDTFGEAMADLIKLTGHKVTKSGDVITIYESNGSTVWRQYNLASGGRVEV